MIKRTYSKRTLEITATPQDAPSKRRRVDHTLTPLSSSPARTTPIFSDDIVQHDVTPPSSPGLSVSTTRIDSVKAVHSESVPSSRDRQPSRPALRATATINVSLSPKKHSLDRTMKLGIVQDITKTKISKSKKVQFTQMRLDLGQRIQKRCQTCGMEYRPSISEDKKLHDKFHDRNVDGIPINHNLRQSLVLLEDEEGLYKEEIIVSVERDRHKTPAARKIIHTALDVVEMELGGVGITGEKLWGEVRMPAEEGVEGGTCDRYKTYLFIRKDKILGVCLAERIFEAHAILPATSEGRSKADAPPAVPSDSAITTAEKAQPATMGISRIWVSKCARGQGIAQKLLRFAAERFIYRMPIPKEQIAFSQPTESGAKLARRFFGRQSGWLVYPG